MAYACRGKLLVDHKNCAHSPGNHNYKPSQMSVFKKILLEKLKMKDRHIKTIQILTYYCDNFLNFCTLFCFNFGGLLNRLQRTSLN